MDRFSVDDSGKKLTYYQEALEFMGEVRSGISRERFNMQAVRYADAFIDMLNETEGAKKFLSLKGISAEYVHKRIRDMFDRLHFNHDNDHYLALCLPRNASEAQINRRWKDLMLIYHPDRSQDEESARCAKRINEAYNVLKYPDKKREYDMRMTTTIDAHLRNHRKKVFRPQGAQKYPFIPPGMRRLLPKLVIPCCMAISLLVLLTIFLNNRPASPLFQTTVPQGKEKLENKPAAPAATIEDRGTRVEAQEAAPPEKFKEFYREAQGAGARFENTAKKQTVTGAYIQDIQVSPPRDVSKGSNRTKARTAVLFEKSIAQETVFAPAGSPALAGAPSADGISGDDRPGRQLREGPSSGQGNSSPDKAPRTGADDLALNEKHGDMETEVFLFVVQYIHAYEAGDISKFMGFFSRSAVENGALRYDDIRESYKKNFESNRYNYTLKNVNIGSKDGLIIVTGSYSIKKITAEDRAQAIKGKMHWTLGRENGSLKILRMDYDKL